MTKYRFPVNLQWFAEGEKSEPATPKKRRDTRRKGQVAKSAEIPAAFILFFVFFSFYFFSDFFASRLYDLFTVPLREYMLWEITGPNISAVFWQVMAQMLVLLAPLFILAVAVAFFSNFFQFGFLFTAETLKFNLQKLNVIEGFKRFFSLHSAAELLKTLMKLLIVGIVMYVTLAKEVEKIIGLATLNVSGIMQYAGGLTLALGLKFALVLIVLAFMDYAFQKWQYEKKLRMTKHEVKEELKSTEGDPKIRARIREQQRRIAMMRMMQQVPKADVVITNPTHYAVALVYVAGEMDAPKVVAKGADYLALKIKEVARKHGVITMENRALAKALYDKVDIGQMIPAELFQAVAEVLAYVYRLKGKR